MGRGTLAALAFVALATACVEGPPDGFTTAEWEVVNTLTPLPEPPVDATNQYQNNPAAALLGQKLFYDTRWSGPIKVEATAEEGALGALGETGKVSCASCHDPMHDFTDTRSNPNNVSLAAGYTGRNAPPLVNVAYYTWYTWGGKRDTLWGQGAAAPEAPTDVNANRCGVAHHLWTHYRDEYNALFADDLPASLDPAAADAARFPEFCRPNQPSGEWEAMAAEDKDAILRVSANVGKALAAYQTRLVSRDSPFDRYVEGERDAMSDSAKRGLRLFVGKAFCVQCHAGPAFTDNLFHNVGVPQVGTRVPVADEGRFSDIAAVLSYPYRSDGAYSDNPQQGGLRLEGLVATESDRGAFRSKGLRNVQLSGPYMHAGQFGTLSEVVRHYLAGGADSGYAGTKDPRVQPLQLTDTEVEDLVAFLEALTGAPPDASLLGPPQ